MNDISKILEKINNITIHGYDDSLFFDIGIKSWGDRDYVNNVDLLQLINKKDNEDIKIIYEDKPEKKILFSLRLNENRLILNVLKKDFLPDSFFKYNIFNIFSDFMNEKINMKNFIHNNFLNKFLIYAQNKNIPTRINIIDSNSSLYFDSQESTIKKINKEKAINHVGFIDFIEYYKLNDLKIFFEKNIFHLITTRDFSIQEKNEIRNMIYGNYIVNFTKNEPKDFLCSFDFFDFTFNFNGGYLPSDLKAIRVFSKLNKINFNHKNNNNIIFEDGIVEFSEKENNINPYNPLEAMTNFHIEAMDVLYNKIDGKTYYCYNLGENEDLNIFNEKLKNFKLDNFIGIKGGLVNALIFDYIGSIKLKDENYVVFSNFEKSFFRPEKLLKLSNKSFYFILDSQSCFKYSNGVKLEGNFKNEVDNLLKNTSEASNSEMAVVPQFEIK